MSCHFLGTSGGDWYESTTEKEYSLQVKKKILSIIFHFYTTLLSMANELPEHIVRLQKLGQLV